MGKKTRKKKSKPDKIDFAGGFQRHIQEAYNEQMNEARNTMAQMDTMTIDQQKESIRKTLIQIGTNCDFNDRNPMDNGDQSVIQTVHGRDMARELYSIGGDINAHSEQGAFSSFAISCIIGNAHAVKKMVDESCLQQQQQQPQLPLCLSRNEKIRKLLETRETSLRLSPLLMIVSAGKNVAGIPKERHTQTASLLLKYGACPDAKDVFGKTVCHYGAGAMATSMTMDVVDMCIRAAQTSYLFGKDVELHSLNKIEMNGLKGIAGGFDSNTGRRSVHLVDQDQGGREIWVKPQNIRLLLSESNNKLMLADVQDRLGSVSLHEVVMNDRVDVAEFLLCTHNTSIHTADMDDMSPLKMASMPGAGMSNVAKMIAVVTRKEGGIKRKSKKQNEKLCASCHKDLGEEGGLKCSACLVVSYCGRECQRKDWKNGHKNECAKLASLSAGVKIRPPSKSTYHASVSFTSGKVRDEGSYRRPNGVKNDEKFVVKVQAMGERSPILVYDETRACEFYIDFEDPAFKVILEETRKEKAWDGRKTFMKASFDEAEMCTMYPTSAGVKSKYSW